MEPESIAGLTAEVSVSGTSIEYDGVRLETGSLDQSGLSPIDALPVIISQWQNGYILSCGQMSVFAADAIVIETEISDKIIQKTWFDVKTHMPVRSEIMSDGYMVIECVFENVILE